MESRGLVRWRGPWRFALVGGIGFCVDGGLLTLLMYAGWEIIPARSVSFLSAATSTWLLNRIWTFELVRKTRIRTEYVSYIASQIFGAALNLAVFFALVSLDPGLRNTPLIPLAFGAVVSLTFNYVASKRFVFKR